MRLSVSSAVDVTASVFSDQVLTGYIDQILTRDDYNGDGYIEYPEYIRSVRNVRYTHSSMPAMDSMHAEIASQH